MEGQLLDNEAPTILITGATGLLAQGILRILYHELPAARFVLVSRSPFEEMLPQRCSHIELDVTKRKDVRAVFLKERPDIVVHTAAMTNVDLCETEKQDCWTVNVKAVEYITEMCRLSDSYLIHFSTDYVFDGKNGPYSEEDLPAPINYYGKSKLASENACIASGVPCAIVRTNVLYGFTEQPKSHFVSWVLGKLNEKKPFKVVDDQFGNPTLIDDVGLAVLRLIRHKKTGVFHIGGGTWSNRFDFAKEISAVFEVAGLIGKTSTEKLGQTAARPERGGLQTLKMQAVLGVQPTPIFEGLHTYRQQLKSSRRWAEEFE